MQHFSLGASAFSALHHSLGQLGALSRLWLPLNMTDAQRSAIKVQKVLLANSDGEVFHQCEVHFFKFFSVPYFSCALLLFDPWSRITNPQHIPVSSLLNKAWKQSPSARPPSLRVLVLAPWFFRTPPPQEKPSPTQGAAACLNRCCLWRPRRRALARSHCRTRRRDLGRLKSVSVCGGVEHIKRQTRRSAQSVTGRRNTLFFPCCATKEQRLIFFFLHLLPCTRQFRAQQ